MPEYKAVPSYTKAIEDRTVIGLGAIHGNVDEGGDRSHPGSFADTKVNGRDRARFLWMHDASQPPTAVINYVRELGRNELPPLVLDYAPEATGGVEISRTYLDTPRGNEILAGIRAGAIQEMSYAYDLSKFAFTEDEDAGRTVREIYGVKTFDWSDVIWGLNPATLAAKGVPLDIEHATALAAVKAYIDRYQALAALRAKEGRVLSGENRKRIESAMEALAGATDALKDLLSATEPQKNSHAETNAIRVRWIEQQQRLRELGVYP